MANTAAFLLPVIAAVAAWVWTLPTTQVGLILTESESYNNLRLTQHLINHGLPSLLKLYDATTWYPYGRDVGGSVHPTLMMVAAGVHRLSTAIGFGRLDVQSLCVLLSPAFGMMGLIVTYLTGRELVLGSMVEDDKRPLEQRASAAGVVAAALFALSPPLIGRFMAGMFDTQSIGLVVTLLLFHAWLRALQIGTSGSAAWAACCYAMLAASWSGYVYGISL